MKPFVTVCVALFFVFAAMTLLAQEQPQPAAPAKEATPPAAPAKPEPALTEFTLAGTVKKQEATGKDKAGTEIKVTKYYLVEASGAQVLLHEHKPNCKGGAATCPDEYVGKQVKVVGKGVEKGEGARKVVVLKTITSIAEEPAK